MNGEGAIATNGSESGLLSETALEAHAETNGSKAPEPAPIESSTTDSE